MATSALAALHSTPLESGNRDYAVYRHLTRVAKSIEPWRFRCINGPIRRSACGDWIDLRRTWRIITAESAVNMAYIHQLPDWPKLTWDSSSLAAPLAAVRHQQGRLLGKMEALGFDLRSEASLSVLTSDVVKSSAIEGETLDPEEVRSSIARRLGLDVGGLQRASRDVEGIV